MARSGTPEKTSADHVYEGSAGNFDKTLRSGQRLPEISIAKGIQRQQDSSSGSSAAPGEQGTCADGPGWEACLASPTKQGDNRHLRSQGQP